MNRYVHFDTISMGIRLKSFFMFVVFSLFQRQLRTVLTSNSPKQRLLNLSRSYIVSDQEFLFIFAIFTKDGFENCASVAFQLCFLGPRASVRWYAYTPTDSSLC